MWRVCHYIAKKNIWSVLEFLFHVKRYPIGIYMVQIRGEAQFTPECTRPSCCRRLYMRRNRPCRSLRNRIGPPLQNPICGFIEPDEWVLQSSCMITKNLVQLNTQFASWKDSKGTCMWMGTLVIMGFPT